MTKRKGPTKRGIRGRKKEKHEYSKGRKRWTGQHESRSMAQECPFRSSASLLDALKSCSSPCYYLISKPPSSKMLH